MAERSAILITGCSSGFGKLMAKGLAGKGHRVFATMRDPAGRNREPAAELTAWAKERGAFLEVVELDVTDETSVNSGVEKVLSAAGRLDVVVNNAGVGGGGMEEAYTLERMKQLYEVNVFGVQRVFRAVLPSMRQARSGLIIQISSILGRIPWPFLGVYSSSKFAVEALAETYRYELAPLGVDSVIVEPGAYPTDIGLKAVAADDSQVAKGYGALAAMPGRVFGKLEEMLTGEGAPDARDVLVAVERLIEMPFGTRPVRTVVDQDVADMEKLNQLAEEVQKRVVENLGMAELLSALKGPRTT